MSYYTSKYSGEDIDALLDNIGCGQRDIGCVKRITGRSQCLAVRKGAAA